MGQVKSRSPTASENDTILHKIPDLKFRVLVVGRANAGKTTILHRISRDSEVFKLDSRGVLEPYAIHPTMERGIHAIEDELLFTNHGRYIFHDSRGIEAGSTEELRVVQEFVLRKSQERRLKNRLHAIWYCIPTENSHRAVQDMTPLENIFPDENVPVIAVFTKYDQFKNDIEMRLYQEHNAEVQLHDEIERVFNQEYLANLKGAPPYIRLEKMHKDGAHCNPLIELTSNALSGSAVSLMLLAVQKCNLNLSIDQAIRK